MTNTTSSTPNTTGSAELVLRRVDNPDMPGLPPRSARAAAWVGWHVAELAGVMVPAVFAVSVTPWAWLVSGVVGVAWVAHEVQRVRHNAAVQEGTDCPANGLAVAGGGERSPGDAAAPEVREVRDGLA